MSLDRSHPVFTGNPCRDRTPPRFRVRSLDEEIGSRTFSWKYRRYICILGRQNAGRRSLARRFFQDRGELRVDGNYWLRGRIPLPYAGPFPRGELDLLIRIINSPEDETRWRREYNRALIAGMHRNAALFIYAFVCARIGRRDPLGVEDYCRLFSLYQERNYIHSLFVGTKCDLRQPHNREFKSEAKIRDDLELLFGNDIVWYHRVHRQPVPYVECSVRNDVNVHTVINEALRRIL